MPFDALPVTNPVVNPATAAIDRMIEFFGPDGERWCPLGIGNGDRRCLLAAAVAREPQECVIDALRLAVFEQTKLIRIEQYNDSRLKEATFLYFLRKVLLFPFGWTDRQITAVYHSDVLPMLWRAREISERL